MNEWLKQTNIRGPQGVQGERGGTWYEGDDYPITLPDQDRFIDGDMYLKAIDPDGGTVWRFQGSTRQWLYSGTDITGPKGDEGPQGVQGPPGPPGTTDWAGITGKPSTYPPTLPIPQSGVTNLVGDLSLKAPINSPALTGTPTAPTPNVASSDSNIATTAFVKTQGYATLVSPTFLGDPKAPTPATADNDTSIATTAFVKAQGYIGPDAPNDGKQYVRKNLAWSEVSIPPGTYIGDDPPANPAPGQMWWESDTGNLYIWYNDGNSSQWVQVNAIAPPTNPPTADTRNCIVNGAFKVSQENGQAIGSTSPFYLADQWFGSHNLSTGVANYQQLQSTAFAVWCRGRMLCATAQASMAAGNFVHLVQYIEGNRMADFRWGSSYRRPAVLRFEAYSDQGGTFSVALRDPSSAVSFVANFTLPAGGANTKVVVPIPAPSIGTWPIGSNIGLQLTFAFACGSTYTTSTERAWVTGNFIAATGISNGMSAANNSLNIWNVGLYLDPDSTGLPPKWEEPNLAEELAACQRYWFTGYYNVEPAAASYTTNVPVQMRAAPSITGGGAGFAVALGGLGPNMTFYQTTRNAQPLVFNARM